VTQEALEIRATVDEVYSGLQALQAEVATKLQAFPPEKFPRDGTILLALERRLEEATTVARLAIERALVAAKK
jgi:hypothetical protein